MQKRDISKAIKIILDKFQVELDTEELTLEELQLWAQEINALLNNFIQQVNNSFKRIAGEIDCSFEVEQKLKPEDEVDMYT